eukprot:scaffold4279_cov99-Isochrysis_galbana.AAC.2
MIEEPGLRVPPRAVCRALSSQARKSIGSDWTPILKRHGATPSRRDTIPSTTAHCGTLDARHSGEGAPHEQGKGSCRQLRSAAHDSL